jgi:hypothetical protein
MRVHVAKPIQGIGSEVEIQRFSMDLDAVMSMPMGCMSQVHRCHGRSVIQALTVLVLRLASLTLPVVLPLPGTSR